ncbi:MAG: metal-sensitive transcriptional regulator [Streptococcaceae bacterium]|jgi:DNA-binding FrmR family transcriptional regulator|nr:metal-sensitive transcriptional regulator [Streptococcaceae bacterium]
MHNYNTAMHNRLKRAGGQVNGVLKMMEEKKDCKDVITQLSAIRSSIDNLIGLIVAENLKECILEAKDNPELQNEQIQEAMKLIMKK